MKHLALVLPFTLWAGLAQAGALPPPTTTSDDDPSLFLGLAWTFGGEGLASSPSSAGGDFGVTLKLLSTNKRDSGAFAAGVTYNFDGTWGCDLGLAYNADDATITAGYDICKRGFQVGLGGTKNPDETTSEYTPPTDTSTNE